MADARNRVSGRKMSKAEEAVHADLVCEAKGKGLDAWEPVNEFKPIKAGEAGKTAVDTRRVLLWEMVGGVETVKARLMAKGFQDPDM